MPIVQHSKHVSLTMAAINTFKAEKQDLGVPASAKGAVIEDIMFEVTPPDVVASKMTKSFGALAIGNQESVLTSTAVSQPGVVIADTNAVVSDATPLPVVYNDPDPIFREGPFPLVKDPDGNWYVTLAVNTTDCTAVKAVKARLDITYEI